MAIRITCINKAAGNHENPYVAISNLGWTNEGTGKSGTSTRVEMHDWVKDGGEAYVVSGQARARLVARTSANGTKYVKTEADNTTSDNLLKLPECR